MKKKRLKIVALTGLVMMMLVSGFSVLGQGINASHINQGAQQISASPDISGTSFYLNLSHPGTDPTSPYVVPGEPITANITLATDTAGVYMTNVILYVNYSVPFHQNDTLHRSFKYSMFDGAPQSRLHTSITTHLGYITSWQLAYVGFPIFCNQSKNLSGGAIVNLNRYNYTWPVNITAKVTYIQNNEPTNLCVLPNPKFPTLDVVSPVRTLVGDNKTIITGHLPLQLNDQVGQRLQVFNLYTYPGIFSSSVYSASMTWTVTGGNYSISPGPSGAGTIQWIYSASLVEGTSFSSEYVTFLNTGQYTISANWTFTVGGYTVHSGNQYSKITVNSDPRVGLSISSGHDPIDTGVTDSFKASASGGTGNYSFNFSLHSGTSQASSIIVSGNSPEFNYTFFSTGIYLLDYTGHSNNFTGNSSILITVDNDPTISISANKTTSDVGNPIGFSATAQSGTTPYYYSWLMRSSNSSEFSIISTSQNLSFKFPSTGSFFVFLSLQDSSGYVVNSSLVSITVNPAIAGYITFSPTIAITVDTVVSATVHLSGGTSISQTDVQWGGIFGGQIGFSTLNVHPGSTPGIYYGSVTVTDSVGSVFHARAPIRVLANNIKISTNAPSEVPQGSALSISETAKTFIGESVSISNYSWSIGNRTYYGKSLSYDFSHQGVAHIFVSASGLTSQGIIDKNTTEVNVTVLPQGTTGNIIILHSSRPVQGGLSYSFIVKFTNNTSFSAAFITIQGVTYQPSNITMDSNGTVLIGLDIQYSQYPVGSVALSLTVIDNQSQERQYNTSFSVQLSQSNTFSIYSIANWFGGFFNFLIFMVTIAGLLIAYSGLREGKQPPVIDITQGNRQVKYRLQGRRIGNTKIKGPKGGKKL